MAKVELPRTPLNKGDDRERLLLLSYLPNEVGLSHTTLSENALGAENVCQALFNTLGHSWKFVRARLATGYLGAASQARVGTPVPGRPIIELWGIFCEVPFCKQHVRAW